MKKILFPTEFANHSPEVFKYAAELAHFFKAHLVILHAYGKPEYGLTTDELLEKRKNTVMDNMIKFVQTHLPEDYRTQIEMDYIAKVGYPNDVILNVAVEQDVDVIVMGMTGKVNALETIFGSTSKDVLAKAECPVLAIPASAKFEGIDNIVYTTNFEFRDLEAINYLKRWSSTFEATIHCTHVLENKEKELFARKNMVILSGAYKGQETINFEVISGDFKKVINGYSKSKKADIIAMMSHKRNFMARLIESSAVKGVARNISTPLLVIKDNSTKLDEEMEEVLEFAYSIV